MNKGAVLEANKTMEAQRKKLIWIARVRCRRCNFTDTVEIRKGLKIKDADCPKCRTKHRLERA